MTMRDDGRNPFDAAAAHPLSRRRLLKIGGLGTLAAIGGGALLSACGDDDDDSGGSGSGTTAGGAATTAAGATGGSGGGAALDKVKAHWVYIGPPDDNGWTQTHDEGRLAAAAALGDRVETAFTPNIGFGAETTQLFRKLVDDGNHIIFANTEYTNLMSDVAAEAPDVKFVECNGHIFTENLFGYYMSHEIPAYLLGVAAGHLAPTGKIGYIGAFPTASTYNDVNGLLLGARSVNPAATVQTVLVSTFFDPQKATQAANALLDSGVEFLFGVMDEPAFLQVAESRGVWTGYWNLDFRQAAPTKYVNNYDLSAWAPFYTEQLQAMLDGTWKAPSEVVLLDCPLGEWGPEVPQDVQDAVAEAQAKVEADGGIYVGPLKDNKGVEKLPAGQTIDSLGAYSIDWAVEGVSGF
jgi:basic membrane lipoprotein Med (substrate-binding protein (PBP1-ABC) superfamily)